LRGTVAIAVLGAALLPAPAGAYVRYRNDVTQMPFFWRESCEAVTIYLNGFTAMSPNEVAKSVAGAAHTWSPSEVVCGSGATATHPYIEIVPTLYTGTGKPPDAVYDARNSLIFRTDMWTMSGKPDGKIYDLAALAITTVFAKPDGHIVDADVEVNAVAGNEMTFANLDDPSNPPKNLFSVYDLQTTLTHEFGHFLGLDHTCWVPGSSALQPNDDKGNPVPICGSGSPEEQAILNTVMYNMADPDSIVKRALSSDEVRAMCDIYPASMDSNMCALDMPNDGIGCALGARTAGRRGRAALPAAVLLVGIAVAARGLRARSRRR
jgi:hypothetical protein